MSRNLDSLETLMTVTGASGGVATLDSAALNDQNLLAICYRTFAKQRQVNVAELYEIETGRSVGRHQLGWPFLCHVTAEGLVLVGDREGGSDEHASDLVRFNSQTEVGAAPRRMMPVSRVFAMDVRPDGQIVCCSGFGAGQEFGPGEQDLWFLNLADPQAEWSRLPNPHKEPVIAIQWAEAADWVLSKSEIGEPSQGYELTFAIQVPGIEEPIWRGEGRNAVVVGDKIVVWVHDGNALEVWAPGEAEPRRGLLRVDGKPEENPLSYTQLPHNMVALDGGRHVALLTLGGLWIVDLTTFDVVRRYPLGSWGSLELFSNRSGEHLACYSGSRAKLWVLETTRLLSDPSDESEVAGGAAVVTCSESVEPAKEVDRGTVTRTFGTKEGGRIELDFPLGLRVVERRLLSTGNETVTADCVAYDEAVQYFQSRVDALLADGGVELLPLVTFKKGRSTVCVRPPVTPVLESGDPTSGLEQEEFPGVARALEAYNDKVGELQATGYKLSTKAWRWTAKSRPTADSNVFEHAKQGSTQHFRLSAKPGQQYGPTLKTDRKASVRRVWMQVRDTKVGPNSWLKAEALHHMGIDSVSVFLTFATDNTIKRAALGGESHTLVDGNWVSESG